MHDLAVGRDHDMRRRMALQDLRVDPLAQLVPVERGLAVFGAGAAPRPGQIHRHRQSARAAHMVAALEDAALLVDRHEQVAVLADPLRRAQQEVAAGLQRIVEGRDHLQFCSSALR